MTFEEFFKKKKINLQNLEQAEPGLFSEFKDHYEQMGEKSFDHTKKYWFNKLRLRFPVPAEVKVEKVQIENTLAEQTITEGLIENQQAPAPKVGFKPRFKANLPKPATTEKDEQAADSALTAAPTAEEPQKNIPAPSEPAQEPVEKQAYKPRFNMKNVKPKTEE